MTTPRDDIAGLIGDIEDRRSHPAYPHHLDELFDEAATQLDALSTRKHESFQKYVDANEARVEAEQERDALSARVKELEAFTKELSNALLACRPLGGSELFVKRFGQYYADPVYCKAAIEERHKDCHEAQKGLIRNRRRAEEAEARALRAEQERDEAYERCLRAAKSAPDLNHAVRSIIQLASGPEKEKKE